jgi:hypothetical protein
MLRASSHGAWYEYMICPCVCCGYAPLVLHDVSVCLPLSGAGVRSVQVRAPLSAEETNALEDQFVSQVSNILNSKALNPQIINPKVLKVKTLMHWKATSCHGQAGPEPPKMCSTKRSISAPRDSQVTQIVPRPKSTIPSTPPKKQMSCAVYRLSAESFNPPKWHALRTVSPQSH